MMIVHIFSQLIYVFLVEFSIVTMLREKKISVYRLLVCHSDLSTERRANIAPRFLISYHKQPRYDNQRAGGLATSLEKLSRRFAIVSIYRPRFVMISIFNRGSDRATAGLTDV